jgi:hypothetical protein
VATKLRLPGLLIVLVLALAAMSAGGPATAAVSCPGQTYAKPFLPWLDPLNYVLVENGSLESSAGWTLTGGARLVSGNEPWRVNSKADSRSLYLPSGSSATSPPMCVTLFHPTLRFFAMNSGLLTTSLRVDMTTDVLGLKLTLPIGLVVGRSWQPTLPFVALESLASPVIGTVQFRFTPMGPLSGWRIDDVYVDPFKQR